MNDLFRLYGGLAKGDRWYNYARCETIKGGTLAVLDGVDKSKAARALNLIKGAVKKLYTADGLEYVLADEDYKEMLWADCRKIGREVQKEFLGTDRPVFPERFICEDCSAYGQFVYTTVNESWDDLIEKGIIDEHYLDTPDCSWTTVLPEGFEIEGNRELQGIRFKEIIRKPLTIGQMINLAKIPGFQENESILINCSWDAQITEIKGMDTKNFGRYVKRNPNDSFCKRHITHQADIEEMGLDELKIGLDAEFRPVYCRKCGQDIGGYLDYTHFFDFLFPRKLSRSR